MKVQKKSFLFYFKTLDYPKILRIHKNEIDYFKGNLLLFILHSEINYLTDPHNNSSISEAFPLKLSGVEIEVNNEYHQQSKII